MNLMKIAYWGILAVLIIVAIIIFKPSVPKNFIENNSSPTPQATEKFSIEFGGDTYFVNWVMVPDLSKIQLFPNFEQKQIATQAKIDKGCSILVNAGFYTQEDKPTGLFIQNGAMLKDKKISSLLNGIVGVTFGDKSFIVANRYPVGSTRIAVQTGPLLIVGGKAQTLARENEDNDRRMVAGIDKAGKFYFLVFRGKGFFDGPVLADLPQVIKTFEQKANIEFSEAINLDGGKHSAFIGDGVSLEELSPIGSFFCVVQ